MMCYAGDMATTSEAASKRCWLVVAAVVSTASVLGASGCGGVDQVTGVSAANDDRRDHDDAGATASDAGASDAALLDASRADSTNRDASSSDDDGETAALVDAGDNSAVDTSSGVGSVNATGDTTSRGVDSTSSDTADTSTGAGFDVYSEPGYCTLYLERNDRPHRVDCTVVLGDVWSCVVFTPVGFFDEFNLADRRDFTLMAPETEDVCTPLGQAFFGTEPVPFSETEDCEQVESGAGPRLWQTKVCGAKATLASGFVMWDQQPSLIATCERRATESVAAVCGCGRTSIERQYLADESDDLAEALAATWAYCSAPAAATIDGPVVCAEPGSGEGTTCSLTTTCTQSEKKTGDSELVTQRFVEKSVYCEPVTDADESSAVCTCEGVVDGVASVSFVTDAPMNEACHSVAELCNPGPPVIDGPATCTQTKEYSVEEEGCGVALSCTVPLLVQGNPAQITTRADMYCTTIGDGTLSCVSNANVEEPAFLVMAEDFAAACEAAVTRFTDDSEQSPVLP